MLIVASLICFKNDCYDDLILLLQYRKILLYRKIYSHAIGKLQDSKDDVMKTHVLIMWSIFFGLATTFCRRQEKDIFLRRQCDTHCQLSELDFFSQTQMFGTLGDTLSILYSSGCWSNRVQGSLALSALSVQVPLPYSPALGQKFECVLPWH